MVALTTTKTYLPIELITSFTKIGNLWKEQDRIKNIFSNLNTQIAKYEFFLRTLEDNFVKSHENIKANSQLSSAELESQKLQLETRYRDGVLPLCNEKLNEIQKIRNTARELLKTTFEHLQMIEPLSIANPCYRVLLNYIDPENTEIVQEIVKIAEKQKEELAEYLNLAKIYSFEEMEKRISDLSRRKEILKKKCQPGGSSKQTRIELSELLPVIEMPHAASEPPPVVKEYKIETSTQKLEAELSREFIALKQEWQSDSGEKLAEQLPKDIQNLANSIHTDILGLLDQHARINQLNPENGSMLKRKIEEDYRNTRKLDLFTHDIATIENQKASLNYLKIHFEKATQKRSLLLLSSSNAFLKLLCRYGKNDLRINICNLSSQVGDQNRQLNSYIAMLNLLSNLDKSITLLKYLNSELFSLSREGGTSKQLRTFLFHFNLELPPTQTLVPVVYKLASSIAGKARSLWRLSNGLSSYSSSNSNMPTSSSSSSMSSLKPKTLLSTIETSKEPQPHLPSASTPASEPLSSDPSEESNDGLASSTSLPSTSSNSTMASSSSSSSMNSLKPETLLPTDEAPKESQVRILSASTPAPSSEPLTSDPSEESNDGLFSPYTVSQNVYYPSSTGNPHSRETERTRDRSDSCPPLDTSNKSFNSDSDFTGSPEENDEGLAYF